MPLRNIAPNIRAFVWFMAALCVGLGLVGGCVVGLSDGKCKIDRDCTIFERCENEICVRYWKDADASEDTSIADGHIAPENASGEGLQEQVQQSEDAGGQDSAKNDTEPTPETPQESTTECQNGQTRACYGGAAGTEGKGICKAGTQSCVGGGWEARCEGAVLPQKEVCNGQDDNCDGQIDEADDQLDQDCVDATQQGECQKGKMKCVGGQMVCVSQVKPQPEDCNNAKDDDCNGKIDENPPCPCPAGTVRNCYTGPTGTVSQGACKEGKQTCDSSGNWGKCEGEITPQKEDCNNKDDDCDGKIDGHTETCYTGPADTVGKGSCKEGARICTAGAWGACQGEVLPTQEICNGVDDNCDGAVDEKVQQACYTGPVATRGKGECKDGTQTCQNGVWGVCVGQTLPQAEACDNKDNDCNGTIDENVTRSCYTGSAGTSGVGTCRGGTQACTAGQWATACSGQVTPAVEKCRDNLDNDCDGNIDEICGVEYDYASVNSNGSLLASRRFNRAARTAAGTYELDVTGNLGCNQNPLFVAVRSTSMQPVSFTCNNKTFRVIIGAANTRTGALADAPFYSVIPMATSGEAFGIARYSLLSVALSQQYGVTGATRPSVGVYQINSSVCNSTSQPVFATIYDSRPSGYAVASYYSSGVCRVRTFDLNGSPADRPFAFWMPSRTRNAWAMISNTGTVTRSFDLSDQTARWSASLTTPTLYRYTNVNFPAWNNGQSIALTSVLNEQPQAISVSPTATGIRAYGFLISSATLTPPAFSVLFLQ